MPNRRTRPRRGGSVRRDGKAATSRPREHTATPAAVNDGSTVNLYEQLSIAEPLEEEITVTPAAVNNASTVNIFRRLSIAEPLEESITATPAAVPHITVGSSSSTLPSSCEKLLVGAAESASALASQDPDISSFGELVDATSRGEKESIATGHDTIGCSPPSSFSLGPPIFFRDPSDWYQTFFIRMDRGGSFHTYPHVGGPFQSLQEADDAIENHLSALQLPEMRELDKDNPVEWLVKRYLYYPDGNPRRGPNSPGRKNRRADLHDMVQALLHQYNDYYNLCKDAAHELDSLSSYQWLYEEGTAYYHFNFMTKTKKDDKEYLFFAEMSQPKTDWILTCCCIIQSSDDGLCYGCIKNGGHKINHPRNTHAYSGGHNGDLPPGGLPLGGDPISDSEDEEDEEAQKERLRIMFAKYLKK